MLTPSPRENKEIDPWEEECQFGYDTCDGVEGMYAGQLPCFKCWMYAPIGARISYSLIQKSGRASV
jgi:hypothetical protein